jgi:hypothetical protein
MAAEKTLIFQSGLYCDRISTVRSLRDKFNVLEIRVPETMKRAIQMRSQIDAMPDMD